MIEDKNLAQKQDDSKEMVTIDYFDRIHKQWIKLDVTKEDAESKINMIFIINSLIAYSMKASQKTKSF